MSYVKLKVGKIKLKENRDHASLSTCLQVYLILCTFIWDYADKN